MERPLFPQAGAGSGGAGVERFDATPVGSGRLPSCFWVDRLQVMGTIERTAYRDSVFNPIRGAEIEVRATITHPLRPDIQGSPGERRLWVTCRGEVCKGPHKWPEKWDFEAPEGFKDSVGQELNAVAQYVSAQHSRPHLPVEVSFMAAPWLRVGYRNDSTGHLTFMEFTKDEMTMRSEFEGMRELWGFHTALRAASDHLH